MNEIALNGKTFEEIISKEQIEELVQGLSDQINADYKDKKPIVIAVLDGAFIFAADLIRKFEFDHQFRFVKLSSYEGMESTGTIKYRLDLELDVQNEDILIIEDIVDTGITLNQYTQHLASKNPKSIQICSLLTKPKALKHKDLEVKYCGKEIDDLFVIGYGLDWDFKARHLPAIYQLKKEL